MTDPCDDCDEEILDTEQWWATPPGFKYCYDCGWDRARGNPQAETEYWLNQP